MYCSCRSDLHNVWEECSTIVPYRVILRMFCVNDWGHSTESCIGLKSWHLLKVDFFVWSHWGHPAASLHFYLASPGRQPPLLTLSCKLNLGIHFLLSDGKLSKPRASRAAPNNVSCAPLYTHIKCFHIIIIIHSVPYITPYKVLCIPPCSVLHKTHEQMFMLNSSSDSFKPLAVTLSFFCTSLSILRCSFEVILAGFLFFFFLV